MPTLELPEDAPPAQVGVVPGRSLMWSPLWDCSAARVLFDRHSGDFWLLEGAALELVHALQAAPRLPWSQALQLAGDEGTALLADLIRAGIVRAWNNAGQPVMATALADVD
jgi:hypothetical protein